VEEVVVLLQSKLRVQAVLVEVVREQIPMEAQAQQELQIEEVEEVEEVVVEELEVQEVRVLSSYLMHQMKLTEWQIPRQEELSLLQEDKESIHLQLAEHLPQFLPFPLFQRCCNSMLS
jgi:hypothetical protein